jgi:hypothetical protein
MSETEPTDRDFYDRVAGSGTAAGVTQMSEYRVYVIGDDGKFVRAIQLDCQNDGAAIETAKQLIDGHDIELWQRDRRIARFGTSPTGRVRAL